MLRRIILALAPLALTPLSAQAADSCSIITKADAVKYIGSGATGGMHGEMCVYTNGNALLDVAVLTGSHGKDVFESFKGAKGARAVAGLGVEAYFVEGTFVAKKGAKFLEIDFATKPADVKTMNPKLPEIAKLALSRM